MRLNLTSMAAALVLAAGYLQPDLVTAQSAARPAVPVIKGVETESARPASKSRVIPFRGTLKSCNASAGTITVGTRTFTCTRETKIYREGKLTALTASKVGETVTGSYRKAEDGKLMAASVYLGGKNPGAVKKNSASKPRGKTPPDPDEVEE
jgi:hypothetical protein